MRILGYKKKYTKLKTELEPKINALEHTLLFIGSKDEKWTGQKEHLEMMQKARDKWKLEARKHFRNYCYKNNSYLGG